MKTRTRHLSSRTPATPPASRRLRPLALALSCVLLTACATVGPDYREPPPVDIGSGWTLPLASESQSADLARWWSALDDPILDHLMGTAPGPGAEDGLTGLVGYSITYRIAVGPNEGRKAFTLQTLAPALTAPAGGERLAKHSGFSLHAGVAAAAHQRDKVERLCRYIARPAVATGRLALTAQGQVRYTLKTPYRDGTTHAMFEPLDFIARLAALVPKPRVHLTRYL